MRKLPESSLISKSRFQELIDTIDSFQGQEREIIILSLGQGYGHPGLWNSEFILNPERFNVAVTRSKLQLILVFDQDLLQSIPRTIDACEASYLLFIYLYLQKRKETFFYDFNEEEVKLDFFLRK
ncbi:MAG: AAA domain-containing protein [Candidatus Odinarchaeota archaeon]